MALEIIPHNRLSEKEFNDKVANFNSNSSKGYVDKLSKFLIEDAYNNANSQKNSKLYLAVDNQEVLGYIFYKKIKFTDTDFYAYYSEVEENLDEYFAFDVEFLCVEEKHKNKGIGKKLISKLIYEFYNENNAILIELWAMKAAVKFYKKFNFMDDLDDGSQPLSTYMYFDS